MKKIKILLIFPLIFGMSYVVVSGMLGGDHSGYQNNPLLKTVNHDPEWKGNPLDNRGRFVNIHEPYEPSFLDLLRWQLSANPYKEEKENDPRRLTVLKNNDIFDRSEDKIVWLGHASFLITVGGKNILTDPVFLPNRFLERFSDLPFDLDSIRDIDYVLLSHNHRDHTDKASLEFLYEKMPEMQILTGLNMRPLLQRWMDDVEIQEAGWYQKYNLDEDFEVVFVPARHWTRRGLADENKRLWGGFYISYNGSNIYFMGDSGYTAHFKEIREIMGDAHYAIMGVGAYKPEWFMYQAHISPTDAIKAFHEMGGKYFIPMHYGTFDLSDEPLLNPLDVLKQASPKGLTPLKPGEKLMISTTHEVVPENQEHQLV